MRLRKPGSRASGASSPSASERAAKRAEQKRTAVRPAGRREATTDRVSAIVAVAKGSGAELLGIARELVRIPAAIYLRVAERLGELVLVAWRFVLPYLVRAWRLVERAFAWAQRAATPARVTVAVALLTAAALIGSQWAELSATSVGVDAYIGVEDVAPAPDVTTKELGSAHAWVGVPLGVIAALLIIGSARGRPGLARLLIPLGIVVIAVSLLIDRPEGLDEGSDAVAYESVTAELMTGFWAQLVSGGVLILLALVLTRVLQPSKSASHPARAGSRRSKPGGLGRLRGMSRTAEAGQ